jgi:hypothetical protein
VEYALEYGFLRLSPKTRQRLNITVMLVTLGKSTYVILRLSCNLKIPVILVTLVKSYAFYEKAC